MDTITWVPVDLLSEIILELSGIVQSPAYLPDKLSHVVNGVKKSSNSGAHYEKTYGEMSVVSVYHAVNPHAIKWAELVPTVASLVGINSRDIVPWSQWVDALRLSEQGADLETNPGLKLLDFFESLGGYEKEHNGTMMPLVATEFSAARSKTLASLGPVRAEWMALWLKQWGL